VSELYSRGPLACAVVVWALLHALCHELIHGAVSAAVMQAIAKLTADNLVFMAKLRAAESTAAAATAEKDELLLALEEHKGPWLDEARTPVVEINVSICCRARNCCIRSKLLNPIELSASRTCSFQVDAVFSSMLLPLSIRNLTM